MANHITQTVISELQFFLGNSFSVIDDFIEIENEIPRPWFTDEQDAWNALQSIIKHFDQLNHIRIDAFIKLTKYKVADLIMCEAPSYQLFWEMQKPELLHEIGDKQLAIIRTLYDKDLMSFPTIKYELPRK